MEACPSGGYAIAFAAVARCLFGTRPPREHVGCSQHGPPFGAPPAATFGRSLQVAREAQGVGAQIGRGAPECATVGWPLTGVGRRNRCGEQPRLRVGAHTEFPPRERQENRQPASGEAVDFQPSAIGRHGLRRTFAAGSPGETTNHEPAGLPLQRIGHAHNPVAARLAGAPIDRAIHLPQFSKRVFAIHWQGRAALARDAQNTKAEVAGDPGSAVLQELGLRRCNSRSGAQGLHVRGVCVGAGSGVHKAGVHAQIGVQEHDVRFGVGSA
mmetsp:Transcript_123017/g.347687  ORF Transcript_123017/g.347687 Transcript_123017/m.347687 type:complete len:269 (-) Transcript_123017:1063-1869(-)